MAVTAGQSEGDTWQVRGCRYEVAGTRLQADMSVRGDRCQYEVRGGRARTNLMTTRVQNDETGVCQYEVRACQQVSVRGQIAQASVSPRKLVAV